MRKDTDNRRGAEADIATAETVDTRGIPVVEEPVVDIASFSRQANVQSLVIGGALKPRRDMVAWDNIEGHGWVTRFRVNVLTSDHEDHPMVRRLNVGEAHGPHRVITSWGRVDVDGWTPKLSFFVWPEARRGTTLVAVGEARDPHRSKFELGRRIGTRPEDQGWTEKLVFWVPSDSIIRV
ncbi:hypothetical protein K440DRAFT_665080 [Wilcoxina mikolae CBS 423.85]|nr:hypothetical protein K440DRAFT_665080 [Wilcoxina mikolae CBS 423.85]